MPKLIAVDIDGTLYNSERSISPKTRDTLAVALNHGSTLVLASGRPIHGLAKIAERLDMDLNKIYLSGSNGAQVAHASTMELLVNETLDLDLAKRVIHHLHRFDVNVMITKDQTLYCEDAQGYMVDNEINENDLSLKVVRDLATDLDFRPYKILIAAPKEYLSQHYQAIQAPFLDELDFVFSASFYFEVIQKNVNKGTALVHLAQKLQLPIEDTIAFGDNQNDQAMIEMAGLGVAMGNAQDSLKAIADEVTLSNDEDGIAHSLKKTLHFPHPKLVAVDMDGTFLHDQNDYDRFHFMKLFERMKRAQVKFVVASGNQYYQLKSFFDGLDDDIVYVAENGGLIVDRGNVLHQAVFSQRSLELVKAYLEDHPHLKAVYCGARSSYVLPDQVFYNWAKIYAHRLEMIESFEAIDETILKINLVFPEAETQEHLDALNTILNGELQAVSSGHGNLDLIVVGSNKGTGLKRVGERYGISMDDMMCFGDGGNDKEMLQECGLSYAMANAPDAVKAYAKYLAPSNNDNGVLRILDVYLDE